MAGFSLEVSSFPHVIFGPGAVGQLGAEAARFGRKAFILTGRSSARRSGLLDRVFADLRKNGLDVDCFEGIEPNPRVETIEMAARHAARFGADVVIALGGGSAMDAAKGLTTEMAYPGRMWEFILQGPKTVWAKESLPIITVPTTSATGSETNPCGVITYWAKHEKMPLINPAALPKAAIMDPELMTTLPWEVTRDGAVDILSHLLELYIPTANSVPLQDRFSEGCFITVMEALEQLRANPADLDARSAMLWANNCAQTFVCQGGRTSPAWSMHFIEHVISAHYDVTHAAGLAALTEAWLMHAAKTVPQRVAKIGQRVFGTSGPAQSARAIADYYHRLGYGGLKSLSVPADRLPVLAADTTRCYGWNEGRVGAAEPLTTDDVLSILTAAM